LKPQSQINPIVSGDNSRNYGLYTVPETLPPVPSTSHLPTVSASVDFMDHKNAGDRFPRGNAINASVQHNDIEKLQEEKPANEQSQEFEIDKEGQVLNKKPVVTFSEESHSRKKRVNASLSAMSGENSQAKTVGEKIGKIKGDGMGVSENNMSTFEPEKSIWTRSRIKLRIIMNHWTVNLLTMIMTIFALFGDDIRLAFFTKQVDFTFYNLTLICLIGFTIEITLNCVCQDNYFNSFYFYLDVISTISLIADIKYITDIFTGEEDLNTNNDGTDAEDASSLARSGRSARVGARAGRLTRVIRLVRLIRIVRLYKTANEKINKRSGDDEFARLANLSRQQMLRKKKKELEDSKRALAKE